MLYFTRLKAIAVRNLGEFEFEPAQKLNYFYGPNASGKTSVLESIYLLSRVRSFRCKRIFDVITKGQKRLNVFAHGIKDTRDFTVAVEKGNGSTVLKYDNETVSTASEQAKRLPVYILTPEHHVLFTGTPKGRRRWLDWALFHVEQEYLHVWKNYHRALRHRNALLKNGQGCDSKEMESWERLMGRESRKIDSYRNKYISKINNLMETRFLPGVMESSVQIEYQKQGYTSSELATLLAQRRIEDMKRGYTDLGPHRSDIIFFCDGFLVAKYLSRGQTKLYGAALIAAQIQELKENRVDAVMLVDDLDAELDDDSSRKMMDLLLSIETQLFVSSLTRKDWLPMCDSRHTVFHVKHGTVEKVIE